MEVSDESYQLNEIMRDRASELYADLKIKSVYFDWSIFMENIVESQ
jgi:hypothetical protein